MHQTCSLAMKTMNVLPYTSTSFTCRLQTHTPQKANVPSLRQQCPPHIHSSRRRLGVSRLIGFVESCGPFVERSMLPSRSLLLRFSVSCIVVAILGYGMMSMYWCCRLSFESGCCSVSWPWGEVARDRARPYGPPYGTRIPCLPKTISPTNRGVP